MAAVGCLGLLVGSTEKYISQARDELVAGDDDGTLFVTTMGDPFTPNRLTQMVRLYVNAANLGKSGSCHLFRHTMATLMLEGGTDIRFIQQMLGHVSLETTTIYTQVSIRKLQEIHAATHPGAKLERQSGGGEAENEEPAPTEAELMAALDSEAEDERDDDAT